MYTLISYIIDNLQQQLHNISATDSGYQDILPRNDTTDTRMSPKSNQSKKSLLTNEITSSLGKDGSSFEQGLKNQQEYLTTKDIGLYDNSTMSPIMNDSTNVHDESEISVNDRKNESTVNSGTHELTGLKLSGYFRRLGKYTKIMITCVCKIF